MLLRILTYPWRALRQKDLVDRLRAENSSLRVQVDLLKDREKNLKSNLALCLSEANRMAQINKRR